MLQKRRIYIFLISACAVGYLWLFLSQTPVREGFSVCVFKYMWGIPCPACGTTHGVVLLFSGNFSEALACNPNSFIIAAGMLFIPVCALYDFFFKNDLLFRSFVFFCRIFDKKSVLFSFLIFEALIWGYNLWRFF